MAKLFAAPFFTALDSDGDPISGATLEWFLSGTSTPNPVYTDNALLVARANPVVADSAGRFPAIYLADLEYKAVLKDALGATVRTIDPIHGAEAADPADLAADNVFTKTTTWRHGDDVASAAALTLGDGNSFDITGVSTIKAIATKGKGTMVVLKFNASLTLAHHATDMVLPGDRNIRTSPGDVAIFEEYAVGDWRLASYQRSSGESVIAPLPIGYLSGGQISNNATDATNTIDVSATSSRDDTNTANLVTTGPKTVSLLVSGVGGLDTGLKAPDTWYHLWQIGDSNGVNQTGFILSTSVSAPTLPSGWDRKRLLEARAVLTDSTAAPNSAIIPFTHDAEEILWQDPPMDVNTAIGTTASLHTLSVPLGLKTRALLGLSSPGNGQKYVSSPDINDEPPSNSAAPLYHAALSTTVVQDITVRTNTSSQVRLRSSSTDTGQIVTRGWVVPSSGQGAGPIAGLAFNVKLFGAAGDGVTEDTAAFQAAIDAAAAAVAGMTGSATVFVPPGEYLLGQVVLKDRVLLEGDSIQATSLKAKAALNEHLLISVNFATLTGQNKWLEADGVPSYIGVSNLRIDGNKAANGSGDGLRLYAKGLFLNRLAITDCAGNGIYTEAGLNPTVSTWPTWPEGQVAFVQTARNDGHGWHMRGPHDLYCNKIASFINGGDGVRLESSPGVYSATTDFTFLHCYSNTGRGLYVIGSNYRATKLRLENSGQEGLYHENCDNSQIGIVQLLDNCRTSGDYQGVIDADSSSNVISNLAVRRSGRTAAGGFLLQGADNSIDGWINGTVTGGGFSTGVGLDISSANYVNAKVTVSDFSGVGGIGLRTGNGGPISWCNIQGVLRSNSTLWNNVTVGGTNNHYDITGNGGASDTRFSGAGPQQDEDFREFWNVNLKRAGATTFRSASRVLHATTVDLNSTATQSFTIPHELLATPRIQDCQLSLSYTGPVDVPPYSLVVTGTTSQNVLVDFKLSDAMGAAEVANIILRAEL